MAHKKQIQLDTRKVLHKKISLKFNPLCFVSLFMVVYATEAILSQGVFPILNEMEDGFVVGLYTLSHSKDEKDQALAKLMAAHFNSTS